MIGTILFFLSLKRKEAVANSFNIQISYEQNLQKNQTSNTS